MAIKKKVQTDTDKILNSDIYDLTEFVDDIKKKNIDGIDNPKETLLVGMYGYLGYEFTSLLQNSIVVASELSNEAIPTRAKFDRNVITHALSLGVDKVTATPANMKVLMMFPEKALRNNMINNKFTLTAETPIYFDQYEFHVDYDIIITMSELNDSSYGNIKNYIYTAEYDMSKYKNPISDIDNPFLPPLGIFNYVTDNMVVLSTNLHQVSYSEIEQKIVGTDNIANKTISFSFENQMSHFFVEVKEGNGNIVTLIPVYDGLYNQEIADTQYVYYQFVNSNTIRLRFDPSHYQPETNSNVIIKLYTTTGNSGNFEYAEDLTINLTSDKYTNLYMILKQRGTDGSTGGLDRKTVEELQRIIPKEALSRGSITTLSDLRHFFNSMNNENSVLHVFRKEDNILTRIYYTYCLMKDYDFNIVPTNTIPVYLESTREINNKVYLESGTPIYYYKYGEDANIDILRKNYVGYLEEKLSINNYFYSFLNDRNTSFYIGTPTFDSMTLWFENNKYINDPNPSDKIEGFKFNIGSPSNFCNLNINTPIYFKMFYDKELNDYIGLHISEKSYDNYFHGIINRFTLKKQSVFLNFDNSLLDYYDIYYETSNGSIVINPLDENGNLIIDDPSRIIKIKRFRLDNNSPALYDCDLITTKDAKDRDIVIGYNFYYPVVSVTFYDQNSDFQELNYAGGSNRINQTVDMFIPGYLEDIYDLNDEDRIRYLNFLYKTIPGLRSAYRVVLDSIMTINAHLYNGQGEFNFNKLQLTEGDLIRFLPYNTSYDGKYLYTDPNTWKLGEVLSIEKKDGLIVSLGLLIHDSEQGKFISDNTRYRLPISGVDDNSALGRHLQIGTDIIGIYKITKFLYTSPLNIVLADDPNINTHRITAFYYLDIIDETRYSEFKCINSSSPIQFIMPSIQVNRDSYLSSNRYQYTISMKISPNIGEINNSMINRTQVIGVFYKNGIPRMYSPATFVGSTSEDMSYEIKLYTIPFGSNKEILKDSDVVNSEHALYIGKDQYLHELKEKYTREDGTIDSESLNKEFFENYKLFNCDAENKRPLEMNSSFDAMSPNSTIENVKNGSIYVDSMYLDFNTEFRVYILYKYDYTCITPKSAYYDGLSDYYINNNTEGLYSKVSEKTEFSSFIKREEDEVSFVPNYKLNDMVLTNVYNTYGGINLLYDYSNIMNSYVTQIFTNDIFNEESINNIKSYIVNRVPMLRYFYLNTEDKVLTFVKEMKRKINYVLDAIDPLECTFGLDFKFFNTYGPSNMYHLTDDDGDVIDLIDNVALTMTFRTKFYNSSDTDSILPQIKNRIKDYLERLDQLDDIHFPNLTTMIESEFSEYLIFFEFVSFNIYDANHQHIITNENMEMLTVVPEFLHVDTNDVTGLPYINIRVVE